MPEKIFVTGGAGFIGAAIVRCLVEKGNEVTIFDDFSRGHNSRLQNIENITKISGDIRSLAQLSDAITTSQFDTVIHLAYINGTENFYTRPRDVFDVALLGMQNLVNVIPDTQVKNFYLASSSEVYQNPGIFPTPEEIPLVVPSPHNPRYSYGLGKIVQEFMALQFLPSVEKNVIFRPHNVYGPNMGFGHVIPELFLKISDVKERQFVIKGDGLQMRSFCNIKDFTAAFERLFSSPVKSGIYNIGTQDEVSILDLASRIRNLCESDKEILTSPEPMGETSRRVPDIEKLKELGYAPTVTLDEGLIEYYNWFEGSKEKFEH
jgi:nucleoside-diphosphate-sugar epimerase